MTFLKHKLLANFRYIKWQKANHQTTTKIQATFKYIKVATKLQVKPRYKSTALLLSQKFKLPIIKQNLTSKRIAKLSEKELINLYQPLNQENHL